MHPNQELIVCAFLAVVSSTAWEVHLCATNAKAPELAIDVADAVIFVGVEALVKFGLEDWEI